MLRDLLRRLLRRRPFAATLEPLGIRIEVPPGRRLLDVALEQGIAFPHRCRQGLCTSCRCRLLEGRVREAKDGAFVLSATQIRDGYVLACQSVLRSDVRVHVDAWDSGGRRRERRRLRSRAAPP